jgi:hypothetical protein
MNLLIRIGIIGFVFVAILTSVVVACGGYAIYTGPLAIPFTVLILIGLNKKRGQQDKQNNSK